MDASSGPSSTNVKSGWNESVPVILDEAWARSIVILLTLFVLISQEPAVVFMTGFLVASIIVLFAAWRAVAIGDRLVFASCGFALIVSTLLLVTVSVHLGVMPGIPTFYDMRRLQIALVISAIIIGVGLRSWWWVVILTTTSTTAMLGLEFWYALDVGRVQR